MIEELLPASIRNDVTVDNAAGAIDPQLKAVTPDIELPALYTQLERLQGKQLEHIAYGWDATVWRDEWPDELKRSIVRNVTREKRTRGSVMAVKEATGAIGPAAKIVEWWQVEPKEAPHTFKVIVTQPEDEPAISVELQEDTMALIDSAKPLRSHYVFIMLRETRAKLGINTTVRTGVFSRVTGGQINK